MHVPRAQHVDAVRATMEQIDVVKRIVAAYSDAFAMAYTANVSSGRVLVLDVWRNFLDV